MEYKGTNLPKETFVKLADAYIQELTFEEGVYSFYRDAAKKFNRDTDFLGLPIDNSIILDAVLDELGDDFSYYVFECDKSWKKFNKQITLADGTHPKVKSLSDLYDFVKSQNY